MYDKCNNNNNKSGILAGCQGGEVGRAWNWACWETFQCRRNDTCHTVPQWDDRTHGDGWISAMRTSLAWLKPLVVFLVTLCNTIIPGSLKQQSNPVGDISSGIRERKIMWGEKKQKSYSLVNLISQPSIRTPEIRVINT